MDVYGENWDGRTGLRFRVVQGSCACCPWRLGGRPGPGRARDLYASLGQSTGGGGSLAGRRRPGLRAGRRVTESLRALLSAAGAAERTAAESGKRQGHWKWLGILNRPPLQLRPLTALRQTAHSLGAFRRLSGFGSGRRWGAGDCGRIAIGCGDSLVAGVPGDFVAPGVAAGFFLAEIGRERGPAEDLRPAAGQAHFCRDGGGKLKILVMACCKGGLGDWFMKIASSLPPIASRREP